MRTSYPQTMNSKFSIGGHGSYVAVTCSSSERDIMARNAFVFVPTEQVKFQPRPQGLLGGQNGGSEMPF